LNLGAGRVSLPAMANGSSATIDIGKCVRFVPEDPDWVPKILIGGGFTLLCGILVGIPFVAGYWVRTLRRVSEGDPRPLPAWDDLGGLFGDGLKPALVALAYGSVFVLVIASLGCLIGSLFMGAGAVDTRARGMGDALAFMGGLGMFGLYAFIIFAGLVLHLFLPAVLVRVAQKDDFAAGFEIGPIFGFVRRNLLNYFLSLVFYFVASFVAQIGVLLCCIGYFPLAFWAYLILAQALGETVRLDPGSA
jgi:Protein of unknown function (DUF4013)